MGKRFFDVFSIQKGKACSGSPSFWSRCGVAYLNGDGSIDVRLRPMSLDGELHLSPACTSASDVANGPCESRVES